VYHPSSCAGRGTPKVKDRIVRTFSLPCTTHPVDWMGGTRQGESPYYSIFFLGRSSSSTTGWVVHDREKVLTILSFTLGVPRPAQLDGWYTTGRKSLLFYLLPWAFLVQHNWMGGTRQGESRYYSIFYLGRSSSSRTGWVVHGREKVVTILSFTLGVPSENNLFDVLSDMCNVCKPRQMIMLSY
jgi:hypothetical protein